MERVTPDSFDAADEDVALEEAVSIAATVSDTYSTVISVQVTVEEVLHLLRTIVAAVLLALGGIFTVSLAMTILFV
jgi:UPF0716 family protein affecting phage T7 exclusion